MENGPPTVPMPPPPRSGFSGKQVILIVVGSMLLAIIATAIAIKVILFPSPFTPVVLSPQEEQQLSAKIAALESFDTGTEREAPATGRKDGGIAPEPYREDDASREISFTERELNAMLAKNTDLAEKLAIDLSADMVSLKLLIPLDPDFPIMGGKTLRVNAGAELAYRNGRPVVRLRGVSLMGVPMPNAWLGNLKNIDLVHEFGSDDGFWKAFADGVDSIQVVEGFLRIRLKE